MLNEINDGFYHFGEAIRNLYDQFDDNIDPQIQLDSIHDLSQEASDNSLFTEES